MEYVNGKASSALSDAVDYSRILHNGVPRDELESLLREHDRAREAEISSLRQQLTELASRAGGGQTADSSSDTTADVRSEISQLRQELATAMASLRGLLSGGDGNLHEMQLASLRRQVSQLEGVLESNYQRELRVAEERESALRSEMAQMRQDLRVALETLYRMPDEGTATNVSVDLKPLQDQIAELSTSFFRLSNEQQALALEREGTLKAELAHMRRDLLVTLEASYELPTERVEALDAQIASWRGQVEELQRVVLGLQDAQDEAASRQQSALQAEMNHLRHHIQSTLVSSLPQLGHEDLQEQRDVITLLAERLDRQASDTELHFERLAERLAEGSSALEGQIETVRADLQSLNRADDDNRLLKYFGEREQSLSQDIGALHRNLAALKDAVEASATQPASDSAELQVLRDAVTSFAADLAQTRNEQQTVLLAQIENLREDVAAGNGALLQVAHEVAESRAGGTTFTIDDIRETIASRLGEVRSDWSEAQTELYRQLVSQMAEVQAELDLVRTEMRAVQPLENESSELELNMLEKVNQILAHQRLQVREDRDFDSGKDLDTMRAELQAVREDLLSALHENATPPLELTDSIEPFPLDEIVHEITARLEAERAEWAGRLSDRDAMFHDQFEQVLQEFQNGLQRSPTAGDDSAAESMLDLPALRADIAELGDSVRQIAASHDRELRTELETLRSDLHAAIEAWTSHPPASPSEEVNVVPTLADRMSGLELALLRTQEEQQRLLTERDEQLYSQFDELRSTVSSVLEESKSSMEEDPRGSWRAELAELRSAIAELAQGTTTSSAHDVSTVAELVSALRNELRDALESIRTSVSSSDANASDQPAIQEGLTALTSSIHAARENQDRLVEAQQQTLQTAIAHMRDEIRTAVSVLTQESVDSFEKRQNQLRMDQLEMERNLAQLRQELVATQADPSNKKKLWR